jgi:hypothetical protein
MRLRMLAGGVDSLYLSARGGVRSEVWAVLEAAKERAQFEKEPVPLELGEGWRLLVRPYGHLGYPYWLTSPEGDGRQISTRPLRTAYRTACERS